MGLRPGSFTPSFWFKASILDKASRYKNETPLKYLVTNIYQMYSKVTATDTELNITRFQVLGASVSGLGTLAFLAITFATENGSFATLLIFTVLLMLAAAFLERQTYRFDADKKILYVNRLYALGTITAQHSFNELGSFSSIQKGPKGLVLEELYVALEGNVQLKLASYLVLGNEGGRLQAYVETWMAARKLAIE